MFNNFFSANHSFYQMKWKNMTQPDRPQMTILQPACTVCAG